MIELIFIIIIIEIVFVVWFLQKICFLYNKLCLINKAFELCSSYKNLNSLKLLLKNFNKKLDFTEKMQKANNTKTILSKVFNYSLLAISVFKFIKKNIKFLKHK